MQGFLYKNLDFYPILNIFSQKNFTSTLHLRYKVISY